MKQRDFLLSWKTSRIKQAIFRDFKDFLKIEDVFSKDFKDLVPIF